MLIKISFIFLLLFLLFFFIEFQLLKQNGSFSQTPNASFNGDQIQRPSTDEKELLISELRDEKESLKNQLKEVNEQKKSLEDDLQLERQRIYLLETTKKAAENDYFKLQEDTVGLQKESESNKENIQNEKDKYVELQNMFDSQQKLFKTVNEENEKLEAMVEILKKEKSQIQNQQDESLKKIKELETNLEQLISEKDQLTNVNNKVRESTEKVLSTKVTTLTAEKKYLRKVTASQQEQIRRLKHELKQIDEKRIMIESLMSVQTSNNLDSEGESAIFDITQNGHEKTENFQDISYSLPNMTNFSHSQSSRDENQHQPFSENELNESQHQTFDSRNQSQRGDESKLNMTEAFNDLQNVALTTNSLEQKVQDTKLKSQTLNQEVEDW